MNERLVLVSANRLLNESMMMHDQSKMFSNEFYHGETRYGIDDGMIDDMMISGAETLGDLTHLENTLNKSSNLSTTLSANMMPLSNDDYFNQFTFNQVTNIMMNNNNNNNSQNNNMSNSNQFTYHTLQSPQIQNNQNYNNQPITSNNLNMNSYMSLTGSQSAAYSSKITTRTPSYNSSLCGSSPSSSSPSSLLSSSVTSLNNLGQSSNAQNAVSSSTNESFDYDNASSSGTPSAPANDPAELARQKQLRGLTLTPEELQLLAKDRQRKDNHNMIERRRRFNINDRIKELGQLLPKNGEYDAKQNKGSILKASVDFILKVKSENENHKKTQDTNKYLISLNKKLCNRIKELEMLCQSNGIPMLNQGNNNNNNNYIMLNNKTENQMNLNPIDNIQLNDNCFTTSLVSFNNQNEICDLDAKSNYMPGESDEHQNISSDGNAITNDCNTSCMSSILIYNENASFQTNHNSNDEVQSTNTNYNQLNKNMKKAKNESKKRINNESNSSEFNTKAQKAAKLETDSKDSKTLKEEPISPSTIRLDTSQLINNETHLNTELFEPNINSKYSTVPINTRFVISTKHSNRANQSDTKVIYDSDQKDSIESTLTSNKDPTLTSSSISSPSSHSSSSPSSSNSSSLYQS